MFEKEKKDKSCNTHSTVYINGHAYNCHTIKDKNGNIKYEGVSPKFLGIF